MPIKVGVNGSKQLTSIKTSIDNSKREITLMQSGYQNSKRIIYQKQKAIKFVGVTDSAIYVSVNGKTFDKVENITIDGMAISNYTVVGVEFDKVNKGFRIMLYYSGTDGTKHTYIVKFSDVSDISKASQLSQVRYWAAQADVTYQIPDSFFSDDSMNIFKFEYSGNNRSYANGYRVTLGAISDNAIQGAIIQTSNGYYFYIYNNVESGRRCSYYRIPISEETPARASNINLSNFITLSDGKTVSVLEPTNPSGNTKYNCITQIYGRVNGDNKLLKVYAYLSGGGSLYNQCYGLLRINDGTTDGSLSGSLWIHSINTANNMTGIRPILYNSNGLFYGIVSPGTSEIIGYNVKTLASPSASTITNWRISLIPNLAVEGTDWVVILDNSGKAARTAAPLSENSTFEQYNIGVVFKDIAAAI